MYFCCGLSSLTDTFPFKCQLFALLKLLNLGNKAVSFLEHLLIFYIDLVFDEIKLLI